MAPRNAREVLTEAFEAAEDPGYVAMRTRLFQVVEDLEASLSTPGLEVRVEMGWVVDMGQQFNVVTRIPTREYRDLLFRAYIPAGGRPAYLDFLGEEYVRCDSEQELEDLVLDFLLREDTRNRLNLLRESV